MLHTGPGTKGALGPKPHLEAEMAAPPRDTGPHYSGKAQKGG